ncbi:MAG TPA: hypothetical protein QF624_10610 [Dehalococcoidia bacterium]|nr:hypothetical protein [Dehalococcoidia bacterium]
MPNETKLCDQIVMSDDDCCTEDTCEEPATFVHGASGLGLCNTHQENARTYGNGTDWMVGIETVSFPDGWTSIAPTAGPAGEQKLVIGLFDD